MDLRCDFCKEEITEPGGLIFSPPLEKEVNDRIFDTGITVKLHICKKCYKEEITNGLLARYRRRK